jgi:uncharacterized protein
MDGKYLSLTTFKRDGTGVATPVWFVQDGARLFVSTGRQMGKAKRIRRNPAVTVAPCTGTGRLRGAPVAARAEIANEPEAQRAKALMARKYRVDRILIFPLYRLVQRLRGHPVGDDEVLLAITPGVPEERPVASREQAPARA